MTIRRRKAARVSVAAVSTIVLTSGALAPIATAADAWPRTVSASYTVRMAGVKFGSFQFSSKRKGARYAVNSNAKLRAFLGAFKWRGSAASKGTIVNAAPWPKTYSYSARRKKKRPKSVSMGMKNRNVTKLKVTPPPNPKRRVPLQPEDKTNVLDPMSAIVALTAPSKGKNPCRQSVAVFDGKHRFDVRLSPKGEKRVDVQQGVGFARTARVCRVRYVPISGHKTGKKNSYIVDAKGIEVWMVPTVDASMYMPYRIVVPTVIGNATLEASAIRVEMSNNRKLALIN
ncbi:MAG: DUF3108 domain-containing protein [Hyphomicrobiaceae bacterium]